MPQTELVQEERRHVPLRGEGVRQGGRQERPQFVPPALLAEVIRSAWA